MIGFIGLTGGLGAGKSTALAALQRLGAASLSSDAVVHELYETDEVRELVVERFGPEVLRSGDVDRSGVAQRAFVTPQDRAWLEELLWPRVGARITAWRRQLEDRSPPPRAAVVEVPLLFEAGMEDMFDATIAVIADEPVREQRAAAREHRALTQRSERQLPQAEKARRATYVVVNDGTVAELESKLSAILDMLS
jgi:dephospho-CoA kinase